MKQIRNLVTLWVICSGLFVGSVQAQQKIENPLNAFTTLIVKGPVKVELIEADNEHIQVVLWDLNIKNFSATVKDSVLTITTRKGMVNKFAFAEVKLYYKNLNRIYLSGGEVTTKDPIHSGSLTLEAESSVGKMDLTVQVNDITIITSGDNTIRVTGTTNVASYHAKMGSRIECLQLEAGNVDAIASGKGEIQLKSTNLLNARASTGGNIFYTGNPEALLIKKNLGGGVESVSNQK